MGSPASRGAGSWAGEGNQASRGAPSQAGTYQQALHIDGRARVSDQRLQLPLAARARPIPRRGLRGAGHFPRRRGPAHAASPGLAPPVEPSPGPAARRCLRSRPARPGAARYTASPPLSRTRAARPVASSPGPGGREREGAPAPRRPALGALAARAAARASACRSRPPHAPTSPLPSHTHTRSAPRPSSAARRRYPQAPPPARAPAPPTRARPRSAPRPLASGPASPLSCALSCRASFPLSLPPPPPTLAGLASSSGPFPGQ